MATMTLTFPDAWQPRIVDALCANFGYQATVLGETGEPVPNPETRGAFAKRMIAHMIKGQVAQYESEDAARAVRETKAGEVEAGLSIT